MQQQTNRKRLHTRQISCVGYQRDDGLWDIEAQITDIKTYDLVHRDGSLKLQAGEALHDLCLCITVDSALTIVDAKAQTLSGPYRECASINAAYAQLIGLKIGPGFGSSVKTRFKGVNGCTHLTELIGPLATTAYQTLWPVLEQRYAAKDQQGSGDPAEKPSPTIDSCHALRRDGEAVQIRWPRFADAVRAAGQLKER